MNGEVHNGRNVATLLAEMKEEFKTFIETRITILKTELRDKLKTLKIAASLAVIGIILLATAYLLFTLSLVGLVLAFLPDNPYRWCVAFLAVAVLWIVLGGVAAYFAKREFELRGLMPKKTIGVLRGDKQWIQSEMRNQL